MDKCIDPAYLVCFGRYPTWISSDVQPGRSVPVVQAGWGSRYIGQLVMDFNRWGEQIKFRGWPILMGGPGSDNFVEEDPFVKAEVEKWKYW